jgi:hypothetical protein
MPQQHVTWVEDVAQHRASVRKASMIWQRLQVEHQQKTVHDTATKHLPDTLEVLVRID